MNTAAAKTATFAKTSTANLVKASLILDAIQAPTNEERMVSAWTCDELTARMGGIQDDAAFDALLDEDITYTEALLITFPALVA